MHDAPLAWGTGVPVSTLQAELRERGEDAFRRAHLHPVLVHHGELGTAATPEITAEAVLYVHEVRQGAPDAVVSAGRLETNDIILPHATISGVHAWLKKTPPGWVLTDNNSRNGTLLDNVPVGDEEQGLEDGATVRLGSLTLTWLSADMFHIFLRNYS